MASAQEQRIYEFEGFRLDPTRRLLCGPDTHVVPLKPKVFDTLLHLVEHSGQLLEKTVLMRAVWSSVVVEENSLNQHISTLRQVFKEKPGENRFIVTVPGRGYLFAAPVTAAPPLETAIRASGTMLQPRSAQTEVEAQSDDEVYSNGRSSTMRGIGLAVALAAVAIGAWSLRPATTPSTGVIRLSLDLAANQRLSGDRFYESTPAALQRPTRRSFAISPDGRRLVYAASDGAATRLYERPIGQTEPVSIPGTEGASQPFFSPNGESIGFFAGIELKTLPLAGGVPRRIATIGAQVDSIALTASWTDDDTILVTTVDGIYELPAMGGHMELLTDGGGFSSKSAHLYPQMLPMRRGVLFNVADDIVPSGWDIVVETPSGERKVLVEGGSDPRYVPSGHILFARDGSLWAVPFDLNRLQVTREPVIVVEGVMHAEGSTDLNLNFGAAQFSVSTNGTLAYVRGGVYPRPKSSLAWLSRRGEIEPIPLPPARYLWPRVSPDGSKLSYAIGNFGDVQIFTYDIALQIPHQLTFTGHNSAPTWSPDGNSIAFARVGADSGIFIIPADGSGEPQRIAPGWFPVTSSWSTDGELVYVDAEREAIESVWIVSTDAASEPRRFLPPNEIGAYPEFSPDGRWLAYVVFDADQKEAVVYLRPFPDGAPRQRISPGVGYAPMWSRDGRELFYLTSDASVDAGPHTLMVVDVETEPQLKVSRPRKLLEAPWGNTHPTRSYDISPDGRFVFYTKVVGVDPQPVTKIDVVLNWVDELAERVPSR